MKPFLRILTGLLAGMALSAAGFVLYGYLSRPDGVSAPPLPLPQKKTAVITHTSGPVFVIRNEKTLSAAPGEQLRPGDVVKVTEGAVAQVQLADKGSALLGSDTLVRFLKLTGADQQLELKTEILTGSLSYKVEKLDDTESIIIEADGTEYEVKGTQFVIEKSEDGTLLIVGEGLVDVNGGLLAVGAQQQLTVNTETGPQTVLEITEDSRIRLETFAPLTAMPFGFTNAPEPVLVEIRTVPPDADIYIDGLKTGTGEFRSLLPKGTVIDVRVRRRGFADRSVQVTADADQQIEISLEPTGLDETLSEEKPPVLSQIRARYEEEIDRLRQILAERSGQEALAQEQLIQESRRREAELSAQLELEKARAGVLETELAGSQAENQKLTDLIQQIQDLTE